MSVPSEKDKPLLDKSKFNKLRKKHVIRIRFRHTNRHKAQSKTTPKQESLV